MTRINYVIKELSQKRQLQKQWVAIEGDWYIAPELDGAYTPVQLNKQNAIITVENPVVARVRKKLKQGKVAFVERHLHKHGVPYVQFMTA